MNAAAIAGLYGAGNSNLPPVAVEVVASTGSTNADLLARAAGLKMPTLLVALEQTAGRGRAGRSWLSDAGGSLTFSLAWHFDAPLQSLLGLPLAAGVALAEALAALDLKVQLKWPNDVLRDGDKLAGVLIETQAGAGGGHWAVIGVGLNLLMPDALEARIGRKVAAAPWLAQMDRDVLMAALLDSLALHLGLFAQAGFAPFTERWNRLHAWQGQLVTVVDNGAVLHEGLAAGVDDSGRLLLDTPRGRIAVMAGDVSLRMKGS
jgi:BirA family transcriptional regulator, biotin operon repressor / biotin---[acetyl-CoA-carboxylase] ligase